MNRVDAILAAIDTGLQTAGDTAYGDDWPGTCWRCGEPAEDLCAGCREWLQAEAEAAAESGVPCMTVSTRVFFCTLDAGHVGDHEAHGPEGWLYDHWPQTNSTSPLNRLEPWQRRIIDECAEIDHIINARSRS